MRLATIEYRLIVNGPRRIDRFEFQASGDYSSVLPEGSEVVNIWVPSKRSKDDDPDV